MGNTFLLLTMTCLAGQDIEVITVPQSAPQKQSQAAQPPARLAALGDPVSGEPAANADERSRGWKLFHPFTRSNNEDSSNERPRFFQRMKTFFGRGNNSTGQQGDGANANTMPARAVPATPASTAPNGQPVKLTEPPLADPLSKTGPSKTANSSVAPIGFHAAPPVRKQASPYGVSPAAEATPKAKISSDSEAAPKSDVARKAALSPKMADKVGHETDYSWITGQVFKESGRWVIHYALPDTIDRYNGRLTIAATVEQTKNLRDGDLVCVHGQASDGSNPVYRATEVNVVEHE